VPSCRRWPYECRLAHDQQAHWRGGITWEACETMKELSDPTTLFRQEALTSSARQNDGQVIAIRPVSFTVLTAGVGVFLVLLLLFLFGAGYTRDELAKGMLIPEGEFAKVYTFKPGVITQVFVSEGDLVQQGKPLFTLEANLYNGTGENTTEFMKRELERGIALHLERMKREKLASELHIEHLKQTIALKKRALEHVKTLMGNQSEKVEVLRQEHLGLTVLVQKGLMSRTDFNSKYASYTDDRISLERMRADTDDRMREIQELEYQVKRLPYELRERLSTMELDISEAQRRLSELSASGAFAVKAPIGGRVTNILGRVGAHVDRDVLLLMILPEQFRLKAELYVPTRIISFVRPGQQVKVRYSAFPYQKFGYYRGHVESVSQSVLKDDELHTNVKLDEAVYRVLVALDEQTVRASGQQLSLQPGMFLEAYLEGERRSLLEWIFEPILGVKNRYAL